MDSTVPEWVHYGSSTADIISDYFAKGLVIFTIFGLPLLFFVVWAIDDKIYYRRRMAAREVTKLDKHTKAGARFERNCINHGEDYALYIWMLDEIKKDLDAIGYNEASVDFALIHLSVTIDDVFGDTSLHERACKMFDSQKDYFKNKICGKI